GMCRRRCATRMRSTGSVSSRAPPTSSRTVACPSHVSRKSIHLVRENRPLGDCSQRRERAARACRLHPVRMRFPHPWCQDTRRMPRGPLQVLVLNFDEANFTGEIRAELARLEETGVLRVLDLLFVGKSETGEITVGEGGEVRSGSLGEALLDD